MHKTTATTAFHRSAKHASSGKSTLRVVPVDASTPVSHSVNTLWLREDSAFMAVHATLRLLCAARMISPSSTSPCSWSPGRFFLLRINCGRGAKYTA